ncbi:hypothetical protein Bca101_003748 [Brassica carinata]
MASRKTLKVLPIESLFEKSLTPSDVGKLNRSVIPKQHAEKYLPLNNGGGDMTAEKGMLLSFEDKSGKFWKFRYSYWNSSQSYVLTKGWSSYVKDKHLDVGDVVFFQTAPRGEASFPSAVSVVSQEARVNTTAAYWNCLATPYRQVHASTSSYPNAPTAVTGSSRTVRLLAVLECHGDVVEPPPCTDRRLLPPHLLLVNSSSHASGYDFIQSKVREANN